MQIMGTSERLLAGVETIFHTMPPSVPNFDHYRPASWLASNESAMLQGSPVVDAALGRFEALFVVLNKLLP
jgi:hypothetical protein